MPPGLPFGPAPAIYEERIVKPLRNRKCFRPVVMILLAVSLGRCVPLPFRCDCEPVIDSLSLRRRETLRLVYSRVCRPIKTVRHSTIYSGSNGLPRSGNREERPRKFNTIEMLPFTLTSLVTVGATKSWPGPESSRDSSCPSQTA